MTKCTITFATFIFTLVLFIPEKTIAIPIIITENFQYRSLIERNTPNNKNVQKIQSIEVIDSPLPPNDLILNLQQNYETEPSNKKQPKKVENNQLVNNKVSTLGDRQPSTPSFNFTGFNQNDEQGVIFDTVDIGFILDDYELSSKMQIFKEIIGGYKIIPAELEAWKRSVDYMVYSSPYEDINRSDSKKSDDNNHQNDEMYFLQWRAFFDSVYFTWIKITAISIFIIAICIDFVRRRISRK